MKRSPLRLSSRCALLEPLSIPRPFQVLSTLRLLESDKFAKERAFDSGAVYRVLT